MKIVIFCNADPFKPESGYQIPIYNRLKYFNYDECLVIINSKSRNTKSYKKKIFEKDISVIEANIFISQNIFSRLSAFVFSNKPFFATNRINEKVINSIKNKLKKFDSNVIYFEGEVFGTMHKYFNSKNYKIISINDSLTLSYHEEFRNNINKNYFVLLFKKINYLKIKNYEFSNYHLFNYCQVVSEIDSNFLKKLNNKINTNVQNIGVDFNYFKINKSISINDKTMLIVGNLVGGNNTYTKLFIQDIWIPFIKKNPAYNLCIISRTLPDFMDENLLARNNIKVENYVDNLPDYYSKSFVVISPVMKKCGMQNKVLEAMSMNKVVIGYKDSFSGISNSTNMKHYIGADDANDFSSLLQNIVDGKINLSKIEIDARNNIINNYNWESLINQQFNYLTNKL